jgi:tellurite resistance protein
MHDQNMAILKSLVTVAWADGEFADAEREMVEALLEAFGATDEQAKEIREYAKEKRTIDDIPMEDLNPDDCRILLQHAVLLSYADGTKSPHEAALLLKLGAKLLIPADEAQALMTSAEARAKKFLNLLDE